MHNIGAQICSPMELWVVFADDKLGLARQRSRDKIREEKKICANSTVLMLCKLAYSTKLHDLTWSCVYILRFWLPIPIFVLCLRSCFCFLPVPLPSRCSRLKSKFETRIEFDMFCCSCHRLTNCFFFLSVLFTHKSRFEFSLHFPSIRGWSGA